MSENLTQAPSLAEWAGMLKIFHDGGPDTDWRLVHRAISQRLLSLQIDLESFNMLAQRWRRGYSLWDSLDVIGLPYRQPVDGERTRYHCPDHPARQALQRQAAAEALKVLKLKVQNARLSRALQLTDAQLAQNRAAFETEDKARFKQALDGLESNG